MSTMHGKKTFQAPSQHLRANQTLVERTLTAQLDLTKNDAAHQRCTQAASQDVVLPDAQSLPLGWEILVSVPGASTDGVIVKTYDATTPATLKSVAVGKCFWFQLVANADGAGEWIMDERAEFEGVSKYEKVFNATTDWGSASGGYYSISVAASVHGMGVKPVMNLFESAGSGLYHLTEVEVLQVDSANGDIVIKVPDVPDCRFAGRLDIV